jgi:hypothetical protein
MMMFCFIANAFLYLFVCSANGWEVGAGSTMGRRDNLKHSGDYKIKRCIPKPQDRRGISPGKENCFAFLSSCQVGVNT